MFVLQKLNRRASSRRPLGLHSVSDGVLGLSNNEYRLVLSVSSINFELKSEAEQDALIEAYQSFLNSLGTGMQIVVRVREMDMDKYLEGFRSALQGETETIYHAQITNYCEFVSRLITSNKILARQFFIILPYNTSEPVDFDLIRQQLMLLADIVSKGLGRLGMSVRALSSLEVLDLFYSFYNPDLAKTQPLTLQTLRLLKEAYL